MIIQTCSYKATIKTPEDPSTYSKILVTFAQNGVTIVEKNKSSLTIDSDESTVTVTLTQSDTALFDPAKLAMMQIKCYKSSTNAPGSIVFGIRVCPALNSEVLS